MQPIRCFSALADTRQRGPMAIICRRMTLTEQSVPADVEALHNDVAIERDAGHEAASVDRPEPGRLL